MTAAPPPSAEPRDEAAVREPSPFNLPNLICATRLFGAFGMMYLAHAGRPVAFIVLYFILHFSDWIDGKLARLWNQRTTFGARLDSIADASIYGTLLLGSWWLKPEIIRECAPWIIVALSVYVISVVAALVRFRKMPSYHTYTAKFCWGLMGLAAVGVFAFDLSWPLKIAMVGLTIANLESLAITFLIPQWDTDVGSLLRVLRRRREHGTAP